jgi:hypothetical protein
LDHPFKTAFDNYFMPSLSPFARRPKLKLRPVRLILLVGLLLSAAALPLVASAELNSSGERTVKVISVVTAFIGGRAQSRFGASTQKAGARRNLRAQALGCGNATTAISFGQTANGTLNSQDCTNPIDGTYYDAYTFDGVAGQQIVIDMTSTAFDAYLYLMRPGETTISPDPATTIQDDDSGGDTNARITYTLTTNGTYTILADSYGNGITPGGTGAYAVTLTQVCTYSLPNASRTVGAHSGTFSDAYTTQAGCAAPSLASNSAFITAGTASAPDAAGNGTFGYTVAANAGAQRSGTLNVAGQTFTVTQFAPVPGALQFNSSTYSVGEGAGSVTVTVTRTGGSDGTVSVNYSTGDGTATSSNDYTATSGTLNFADGEISKTIPISIVDDAAVEGDETFNVTLSNATGGATLGSPITATVTINDNDTCSFSINPTGHASPSGGDSGSVSVTAPVGCGWTAASNASWLTITSGASGNGNGTVGYTVASNPNSATRTGTLTIAGQTFTVTQSGISCTFTLSSAGQSFNSTGGTGSVGVTTAAQDCAWSATSNDGWINVTSGASGTGNGSVGFSVGANPNSATRTGTITIAGQTFTITQTGISCTFSISPTSRAFAYNGGADSVGVTAAASDCSWSASSNDSWITINFGATGIGNGTVNYSVAANSGAARNGTMAIAGQTFTVTQAASPGVLQFSPATYSVGEGGASITLTVARTGAAGGAVSVDYSTVNGTATSGNDYTATSGTLNFADGETSKTISIPILEDAIVEGDETFNVTLSNATGGATLGSASSATVTINDNDTCSFSINPTGHASPASGDSGSVGVTSPVGCSWTAASNVSWITITSGASGSATGTVDYSVAANAGASRTGTLTIAGQTFTVTQAFATYTISGHISDSGGSDLPNTTVTLNDGATNTPTTTDAQGNYSFANLAAGGDYIVTPSRTNYSFAPASVLVGNLLGDQTINFVGTIGAVTLGGHISDSNGNALSGVRIDLGGDVTGVTTTDAQGNYAFSVAGNHSYTVTPSRTHYTFNPTSRQFNNLITDETAADFVATLNTHAISGHIVDSANAPLAGVTVSLTGGQTSSTTTNASGDYSFANLPAGATYTVTPTLANYTFTPASRTFSDLGSDQTANFTGTLNNYTISGHVSVGTSALSGVTVTLGGSQSSTAQTDANGNYSFTVPAAGNYTVTPTKQNYAFTPTSQQFNNLSSNQTANFSAALVNYTISGQVTGGGAGLANVTVTLSGGASSTTTTNAQGNFSFSVAAEHNYTITPTDTALYSFAAQTVTNLSANQQLTFAGTLRAYTISGHVASGVASLSNVTITLGGDQPSTTTTDAQGNYTFANLPAGKNYTVTPSRANYTFAPPSATFNNLTSNQSANFAATLNSYTISGQVTVNSSALAGVTVALTGSQTGTVQTGANGSYSFTVAAEGNYTVTPSRQNYTFTPASKTFTNLGSNQSFDFAATLNHYDITGRITDANNVGIAGATVTLSGGASGTTTTDANGNYSFTSLAAEASYTVTPSKTNYSFTPASRTLTNLSANQTANFTAGLVSYSITGTITDANNAGLSGVTVSLSGSASASTTTDANGNYSFPVVTAAGSYTVTPAKQFYTFTPQNRSFTNLSANQTANFSAALVAFSISGQIVDANNTALAGATVTLSGSASATTTTDAQGNYSFATVAAGGNYTVTPSKSFYTFLPASRTFANLGANQTLVNFTATLNRYTVSGRITLAGDPLSGVVVTMSGGATGSATTDGNGIYVITSVPGGASVTLTPAKTNYTFNPTQQSINIDGDRPNIDFVASIVPTVLQFSQAQDQVAESAGRVVITVTRSGNTSTSAGVDVRTVDNTAAVSCGDTTTLPNVAFARCDYATTVETLSFAPNETTKTISVPIIDDSYVDPGETFQLSLSNPTGGATIGQQATTLVAITDNDVAGESNPIFNTDFFVRMQYLDFLSREPEAGQPWSNVLNNCGANDPSCDRISVSANFFRSQEFQIKGLFVFRFYKVAFNRLPHYSEIVADMRAVTGTTTTEVQAKKSAFTNAFAQRQEFKNSYDALDNNSFVNALMDRYALQSITTPNPATPDDASSKITLTRADLVARLNGGVLARAQVVRAIADSDEVGAAEFNPAFVAMQYFGYLRRDPEPQGYADWLRTINANPADFRSMVNGFMNSTEYRLRFGQP